MNGFSNFNREALFNALTEKQLDVLVIGGGVTGAGIALDASSRGLNTGLVEMQDFAAGTSSRSTKLVHGGLRYLKQFEIKMVAEVGRERAIVYENGPHVTTPEKMLLPFYKGGTFGSFTTNIGLLMYDFLAGVKKAERRMMLKPKEVLNREPLVKEKDLIGGGLYVEYKTDDARLTIEILKKAVQHGTKSVNYAKVIDFLYEPSTHKLIGAVMEDQITKETYSIYAKKIVNAGGPWVDELREIDKSKKGKSLHLTKGVHLVFTNDKFPLDQAVYFDTPDGRMIFAIPRGDITYVGTTDTDYAGNKEQPLMTVSDRDYLLRSIDFMFPSLNLTADDVVSSWAGLRPLIAEEDAANPSEISRKDEIFTSDSGLISIAGGKLTGYRKMAESVVDTLVKQLKEEEGILFSASETKYMPLAGGEIGGSERLKAFKKQKIKEAAVLGISEKDADKMVQRYGANTDTVLRLFRENQSEAKQEHMDPLVFAELLYALHEEAIYKPADFFVRRTGALFFEMEWLKAHKESVIQYMAKALNWTKDEKNAYSAELEQLIYHAIQPAETSS
ncbi:glycerol-3-phosphate dehydrogenase/oxidase [Virgibacillus sp. YIM 98842]|uniref:glycerol-3-phosphate dehydrogenase/oxidase n=1 Tax=Virgibacillus sp. YIM 98842 TaxID=2663533 RepID=UPI0013DA50BB|nr:glycerol-3-phosphate dehydrogenase/oxidase [Virgibacillus sp. YIM 98842]